MPPLCGFPPPHRGNLLACGVGSLPAGEGVAAPEAAGGEPLDLGLCGGAVGVEVGEGVARARQPAPGPHQGAAALQRGLPGEGVEAGAVARRVDADEPGVAGEAGEPLGVYARAGGAARCGHSHRLVASRRPGATADEFA